MSRYHNNSKKLLRKIGEVGTCVYCGKENSRSLEHIIPLAVYKWTDIGELDDYNDVNNLVIACTECNERKGCTVPTKEEALKIKSSCSEIYDKLSPAIEKYNIIIDEKLKNQNNQCGYCKKSISREDATIRRKDDTLERGINNAILVCTSCNNSWRYIRKRLYIS